MSVDKHPGPPFVPDCDSPHVVAIMLRVSAQAYAAAAGELKDGNRNASPLNAALLAHGAYVMAGYTAERISLRDITTWQLYSGPMPALLAEYLAGFEGGVRILEDHAFELTLVCGEA
jgi:hypothetical protein